MHGYLQDNVIIAARRSRSGASNALLRALRDGQIEAVANVTMMLEHEAVFMRLEQRQVMGMSIAEALWQLRRS